jgi:hypothetical protein
VLLVLIVVLVLVAIVYPVRFRRTWGPNPFADIVYLLLVVLVVWLLLSLLGIVARPF